MTRDQLQMEGYKALGTPPCEEVLKRTPDEEAYGSEHLEPATLAARANYTAQEGAEMQFAVKELCRIMSHQQMTLAAS